MQKMKSIKWAVILVLILFAIGCGRVALYQNLSEEEVNEILVLLSENNIKAVKKKTIEQNEATYSVEVNDADMARARSLLVAHNLPRKKELGLSGVYKDKGLIPTPDEQKARYLLSLKGDIINLLQRLPQIVSADVVLNVPTKDEFADAEKQKLQRPTASVVVRVKPEASGLETLTEAKIQQQVASAVEVLIPRDVSVIISYLTQEENALKPGDVKSLASHSPSSPPAAVAPPAISLRHELMGLNLDAESKERLKVYLLVFFLLLVLLSTALIVVIVQGSRMRRTLAALKGPAGGLPAIEGQLMEEGPERIEQPENEDEL